MNLPLSKYGKLILSISKPNSIDCLIMVYMANKDIKIAVITTNLVFIFFPLSMKLQFDKTIMGSMDIVSAKKEISHGLSMNKQLYN